MKLTTSFTVALTLCIASCQLSAALADFTVSYLDGGSWNSIYAQGFSPAVSPNPDPGLGAADQVELTEFSFFKSGNADSASDIKLAIIEGFFPNIAGMNTGSSFLVGLSDNVVASTASLGTGDPITFTFSNLPLTHGDNYAAVLVSQSGSSLTPQLVSALTTNYEETPPGSGTYIPASNYGTDSQYEYSVSNFIDTSISGSYFHAFDFAGDANFVASFATAVPEPTTTVLGLCGLALAFWSRGVRR